jgi:flap endonuclease-1
MGIKNLMKVLNKNVPESIHEITIKELYGKKIAIDTSIILYQYVTAIRSSGDDLKGPDGKSTSHIQGILSKSLNYLRMGIIPVFVFDGKPPQLKMKILNDRSKIKKDAINKLIELEEKTTNPESDIVLDDETINMLEAEKIKLLKQSVSISQKEMLQAYEIVKMLGIPAFLAPEEADSQCAYLSINDFVDYVATEDMDLLTFGTNSLIRNFTKKNMVRIELEDILTEGELTMDQFIDICILLGCDYTDTIEGIGQKRAWDLIKKYGSLEELIAKDKKIAQAKYKLPDNFRYEESREYFKNPRHIPSTKADLELKNPQLNELKQLLITKYGFSEDSVEKNIKFLRKKYNIIDKSYEDKKTTENEDPFIDDEPKIIDDKPKTSVSKVVKKYQKPKINSNQNNKIGIVAKKK